MDLLRMISVQSKMQNDQGVTSIVYVWGTFLIDGPTS